ncbi:hypothetical protein PVIIG_06047 [Plasmodium vivax India VII]|uniref:Uncharacterized protein n=1 Tax=Plasmodium vivax India VII TaxID=1077284 RepID=A0A0J9S2A4_PLAVI|nr:hypothetical protein PVIIG_06047 [Plasmodium vivax India VII]
MIETETNDTYFNYNDYATIQGRFLWKLDYDKSYDTQFLDNALKELKAESGHEITFSKIFIKLQKHLNQDGILGYEYTHNGCKYINYVLNNDMRKSILNIRNETAFDLFKKFENKFQLHKKFKKPICHLRYISDDIYRKMNSLYSLYDKFTSLKDNYTSKPKCKDFPAFVFEFNNFVWHNKDNESHIYKEKLKNFINVIKQHEWTTKKLCKNELSQIASLNPDSSVKKDVSVEHDLASSLQSTSLSSSHPQSVLGDQRLLHTNGLTPSEEQPLQEKEEPAKSLPHAGSLGSTGLQDNSVTHHAKEELQTREALNYTDPIPPRREQNALEGKFTQEEEYTWSVLPSKGQKYPELSVRPGVLGSQSIENETLQNKGYLRTVTDAVSGFMEGVDPVPVVGVSEEDDTDNESLLDSMEHIQDFSQVFKDLKKGIFQIIKLI